jgi:hypothetical protein
LFLNHSRGGRWLFNHSHSLYDWLRLYRRGKDAGEVFIIH